jgi:membrane associated rhomboid family serine protease
MIPLKDSILRFGLSYTIWTLIVLNGIVFIFEISISKEILEKVFYFWGLVPARYSFPKWAMIHGLSPGDYFPFLTNMFIHAGWLHIIGNMWFLYLFGRSVEDRMGHIRFLIFYLLSGLAANIVFYVLDIHAMIPEFGASGAIAGVMGAYILMFPQAQILTLILVFIFPLFINVPAFIFLGFWFLIQLFSGTLTLASHGSGGGVAWWAHVGGFATGMLLLPLFKNRKLSRRKLFPDETYHYIHR